MPRILEITLENPLPNTITHFEVIIKGDGLSGPSTLRIEPLEDVTYELEFLPLSVYGKKRGEIAFINEELGEIWYKLNLSSSESPVVKPAPIEAQLGKTKEIQIALANPSQQIAHITHKISNPFCFKIKREHIAIPPKMQSRIKI